jgi:hypothetical protein
LPRLFPRPSAVRSTSGLCSAAKSVAACRRCRRQAARCSLGLGPSRVRRCRSRCCSEERQLARPPCGPKTARGPAADGPFVVRRPRGGHPWDPGASSLRPRAGRFRRPLLAWSVPWPRGASGPACVRRVGGSRRARLCRCSLATRGWLRCLAARWPPEGGCAAVALAGRHPEVPAARGPGAWVGTRGCRPVKASPRLRGGVVWPPTSFPAYEEPCPSASVPKVGGVRTVPGVRALAPFSLDSASRGRLCPRGGATWALRRRQGPDFACPEGRAPSGPRRLLALPEGRVEARRYRLRCPLRGRFCGLGPCLLPRGEGCVAVAPASGSGAPRSPFAFGCGSRFRPVSASFFIACDFALLTREAPPAGASGCFGSSPVVLASSTDVPELSTLPKRRQGVSSARARCRLASA